MALSVLSAAAGSSSPAQNPGYTFESFLAPGATWTFATGINNRGQAIGVYHNGLFTSRGSFIYDHGAWTFLDMPGATEVEALGINDAGDVVGRFSGPSVGFGSFLYSGGSYSVLPSTPNGDFTDAWGINNGGTIVGSYFDFNRIPTDPGHGFILRNGTFTTLAVPQSSGGTSAAAINEAGQVVGDYDVPCPTTPCSPNFAASAGYVFDGGTYATITYPGAYTTGLVDINNRGQVLGFGNGPGGLHFFVYGAGVFRPLFPVNSARGFNDVGQIAGGAWGPDGLLRGYIATPTAVPEPATLALVGGGLLCLGVVVGRKRTAR